jgi:peptidoglycan/LPS O-acetylase OafA/YrhL
VKYTCWFITATAFLATEIYYQILRPQSLPTAVYESTHRIFFTSLFGWIILSFHHLRAGSFVRWFLSHPLWQPTAKLSLSIYLVHDLYIIMSVTNIKELAYFDVSWMMHIIAGDIVICVLFGVFLYLLVEAPTAKLLNLYLK